MKQYIKSILFGEKFAKTAETAEKKSENDEKNTMPFSEKIFGETADALESIKEGTERISKTADISEKNSYLRQGNDDDWESYNPNAYSWQEKYKWLKEDQNQTYYYQNQQITNINLSLNELGIIDNSNIISK